MELISRHTKTNKQKVQKVLNSMKLISGTQVENEGLQLNGRFESGRSSELGQAEIAVKRDTPRSLEQGCGKGWEAASRPLPEP
jgi:hypothetical protein